VHTYHPVNHVRTDRGKHLLRQGPDAVSLEARQTDQGTKRAIAIGRAFGQSIVALSAAPLLKRWRLGRLVAPRIAWSGIAAMVAGLTVRVWAQLLSNFLAFSVALLSVSLCSSYHPHLC
jgi:hypothetical protein